MIRSLYNLKKAINKHIVNQGTKEFKLIDVKPLLNNYNGIDWYDYKIKNSVNSNFYNEYQQIPIQFKGLESELYNMHLILWRPFSETSIKSQHEGEQVLKVLEGELCVNKFNNADLQPESRLLKTTDTIHLNNLALFRFGNNGLRYSYSLHIYYPPYNNKNLFKKY
jgi:hypothetical protein